MRFMGCDLRSGFGRARRAIPIGLGILGILLSAVHAEAAAAAGSGSRWVAYRGYSFQVPRSWRVINLAHHRRTCVRFDRHAVYLGTPPPNQACPSQVFGTTEAMLVEPAAGKAARTSTWDPVARQVNVTARRIRVTATFDTHRQKVDQILASAGLPHPVKYKDPPAAQPAPLPAAATNYHGRGFDTCTAPSEAVMRKWWFDSPYAAIGIYLGGSDAACSQPNLTPAWLRDQFAQGWHFIPLYVGPQAAFGELTNSAASQGAAAATDAAHRAQQLGLGPKAPIYYDMEGYPPRLSTRVLRFFSAWTTTLHRLGYSSGVYSSSLSGIADLARQYGSGVYTMPDVIYDALWNGHANTADSVFSPGQWAHHQRLHQYNGNITQTYGGIQINIDQDFMNVQLALVQHGYQTLVKGLRVRNAPSTSAQAVDVLGVAGSHVAVDCYTVGNPVFGDAAWYHLVAPHTGYVAGFYLNTGRDPATGVPLC